MQNFAPVAPPELLMLMKEADLLGDYHLLLAHDVAARSELYAEIFDDVEATIIMDNSLIELGEPVSTDIMHAALEAVPSNYIVLPDHLGDVRATIIATQDVVDDWDAEFAGPNGPKLMGVIHGNTIPEIGWCMQEFKNMPIHSYAIPKIVGDTIGSRRYIVELCIHEGCVPIHLLGFTNDAEDDAHCVQLQHVIGIDSAVPQRLALEGISWTSQLKENSKRGTYWEDAAKLTEISYQMRMNLVTARSTFLRRK